MTAQLNLAGFEPAPVPMECRIAMASELFAEALRLNVEGYSVSISSGTDSKGFSFYVLERTADCGPQLPPFNPCDSDFERRPQWFEADWYRPAVRVAYRCHVRLDSDSAPQQIEALLSLLANISTDADRYVTIRGAA